MKRVFFTVLALLLVCSVTACSAAVKDTNVSGEETVNAEDNVYGKEDTKINVPEGGAFTIRLDENPTTGYSWSYVISDETIVKMDKDDYQPDKNDKELVGSGGTRILTFKALKKGSADITMVYERSFEKNPDDQKILYNVTVD